MAERRKAAQGSVSSARSVVTARGADTSSVEGTMELSPDESGDAVPREGAPCCAAPTGEGTQAPISGFDVLLPACPSRTVLRHVVDRWTPLAVMVLVDGSSRFGELHTRVGGVTLKVLTQTLQSMERNGLVTRTQLPGVPPRADYKLTDLGRSLQAPIDALRTWIHAHSARILAHRESYDAIES